MKQMAVLALMCIWASITLSQADSNVIDIKHPYAAGRAILTSQTIGDIIEFSNGIKLKLYIFGFQGGPTPVEWWRAWSFIFCDSTAQTAGYKSHPDNVFYKKEWMGMGAHYMHCLEFSIDTVWKNVTAFPDSLSQIDTIADDEANRPKSIGKMIVAYNSNMNDDPFLFIYPTNVVVYICASDNRKIAVQFDSLFTKEENSTKTFHSLLFKWAADSAGNGIFKIPLTETISQNPKICSSVRYSVHNHTLVLYNNSGHNTIVDIYAATGKRLYRNIKLVPGNTKRIYLRSGVYIVKHIASNRNYLQKVLIK